MPTKKHHRKHHKKHHKQGGAGFFDTLKKGFNFVKDNGLISKGLSAAGTVASALGKPGIGNKLSGFADTAKSMGAGRHKKRVPKLSKYSLKSPTMKAEVANWDNNNRLSGTGRKRKHRKQHGKGFFDLIGPIASGVASLLGGGKHHGGGLNLAGGSLKLAGMGHRDHMTMNPHLQNYSGEQGYHMMGHNVGPHRRNDHHLRGSGFLSRVNRGHSKNALA